MFLSGPADLIEPDGCVGFERLMLGIFAGVYQFCLLWRYYLDRCTEHFLIR
jgi:hypothetical protein